MGREGEEEGGGREKEREMGVTERAVCPKYNIHNPLAAASFLFPFSTCRKSHKSQKKKNVNLPKRAEKRKKAQSESVRGERKYKMYGL